MFYKHRNQPKGRGYQCRSCYKEYYQDNKKLYSDRSRKLLYGLDPKDYEQMVEVKTPSFERILGRANDFVATRFVSMAKNAATADRFVSVKDIKSTTQLRT